MVVCLALFDQYYFWDFMILCQFPFFSLHEPFPEDPKKEAKVVEP